MGDNTNDLAMRRVFFRNNLLTFLALLFLPMLVMGSLSVYLVHGYIRNSLDKENKILLEQLVSKVDLIVDQFNPLILTVDIDGQSSYVARKLLDSVEMNYTDVFLLNNVKDQLSSLRNAREYIHSINLYFANTNQYYLSDTGKHVLTEQDAYWFDSYQELRYHKRSWDMVTLQNLKGGASYKILSLFHVLGNGEGVIVINLRLDYLKTVLEEGLDDSGHRLMISDEQGLVLLGSPLRDDEQNQYLAHSAIAESAGWRLTLFSDREVVFRAYRSILTLTLVLSSLSLVVGIILSLWFTQRRTRQIYEVVQLLEAAQRNEELPPIPKKQGPTYGYIIHQIVNTFLQQSYLKTQLEVRKYKLKTAQLMALQAQLNPHFLFNTLETLNWKAYDLTHGPNHVTQMIEYLSDLMRYSLSPTEDMVTLEEEIESIKSYVALQKMRYQNQFDVIYQLSEEALSCKMPRMLLQPIVENAIYHGIKILPTGGIINVCASFGNHDLHLRVSDNGAGMSVERINTLVESFSNPDEVKTDHIGLANVNARLCILYNRQIHVVSELGKGTTIDLDIPQTREEN